MRKVMVIEDEMISALNLIQIVQSSGCIPIGPIVTGKMAIQTALQEKPDFMLMDIILKDEIDGIAAVKCIHEEEKFRSSISPPQKNWRLLTV